MPLVSFLRETDWPEVGMGRASYKAAVTVTPLGWTHPQSMVVLETCEVFDQRQAVSKETGTFSSRPGDNF